MENYFYNESCPRCNENTLDIIKSSYHHIECCSNEECNYKYEEFKEGYEEFLYEKHK